MGRANKKYTYWDRPGQARPGQRIQLEGSESPDAPSVVLSKILAEKNAQARSENKVA